MTSKQRLFLIGSLLGGVIVLGCQTPLTQTRVPRVLRSLGEAKIDPDASLAVILKPECPANVAKGYDVKALPAGVNPEIDHLRIRIKGDNLIKDREILVSRSELEQATDCSNIVSAVLALNVIDLPDGDYVIDFQSLNAAEDKILSADHAPFHVSPGFTNTIVLHCNTKFGRIKVEVDCCGPSAVPTPVPTPTPTPTPIPPFNPNALMSLVTGIEVDASGNVYLLGVDPGIAPADAYKAPNARLVRIQFQQIPPTADLFFDNMKATHDAEISGDTLILPNTDMGKDRVLPGTGKADGATKFFTLPSNGIDAAPEIASFIRIYTQFTIAAEPNATMPNATTVSSGGTWESTSETAAGNHIREFTKSLVPAPTDPGPEVFGAPRPPASLGDNTAWTPHVLLAGVPLAQSAANPRGIIWSARYGILVPGATRYDAPIALEVTQPAPPNPPVNDVLGMALAPNDNLFVARNQDSRLYSWNPTTHFKEVFNFGSEFPRMVESGPGNSIYVLTYLEANNTSGVVAQFGGLYPSANYRVWKLDYDSAGSMVSSRVLVSSL